jgi:hypothetical protein
MCADAEQQVSKVMAIITTMGTGIAMTIPTTIIMTTITGPICISVRVRQVLKCQA